MASRLVLQQIRSRLLRCREPFSRHSAISMSCEVAIGGYRRNGGRGSGGLRARGLEPSGEPGMRHVEEGGNWR
jgi:hypothetical protein